MTKKTFKDFTNLYEVTKTLRFELKPIGETSKMLEDNKVFEKDEFIQKKYVETKKYFDRLHREFVKEALQNIELLNLEEYSRALKNVKKITRETLSKNKKNLEAILENQEKRLRKEVIILFNKTASFWAIEKYSGLKNEDIKILEEEAVFSKVLKERYGNEEESFLRDEKKDFILDKIGNKISIFDEWKGFTGYFEKFFETRMNFYKDDGTSTALATRIVDQNLRRFYENLEIFIKIKDKLDFSEIEKSFSKQMLDVFSLDFYNKCVLQDGIDFYNKILGGETLENGEKLKGINELINKYRQDNKVEKLPFLKSLDKQILSEKDKNFIDEIDNEDELKEELEIFKKNTGEKIQIVKELFKQLNLINDDKELAKIYITKEAFNTICHKWAGSVEDIEKVVFEAFKNEKDKRVKYIKSENIYTFPNYIPLKYVKNGLNTIDKNIKFWKERYYRNKENKGIIAVGKKDIYVEFLEIFSFEFNNLFEKEIIDSQAGNTRFIGYNISSQVFDEFLNDFSVNKKSKIIIKDFVDNVLSIYQMAKYFAVEKKRKWNPEHLDLGDFYTSQKSEKVSDSFDGYETFYGDAYEYIVKPYNLIRNYLTKKPWEDGRKWKLNFENSTLANGWDKNKETDNFAIILRKDKKYFLGLMKKGSNHLFENKNKEKFEGAGYEKMVYKFSKDVSLGIPKSSTQVKGVITHFISSNEDYFLESGSSVGSFIKPLKITKEIFEINNRIYKKDDLSISVIRSKIDKGEEKEYIKSFQKEYVKLGGDLNFYKESVIKWINFCKDFLAVYPSSQFFDYSSLKKTSEYRSIDEFYTDVDFLSYKILFQNISEEYIERKNQDGELYLFQIKNKDWNDGSTGIKNLHTLYFENLFSDENISQNFIFKLNGQAEIFYRPRTSKEKLGTKKDGKGKEVVNHKRYNEDKTFFHVPMTLNRETGKSFYFNRNLNEFLANNSDINIIGVDRGEKHLAYYSVINQNQEILDSGTLNQIENFDENNSLIMHNEKKIAEIRNEKNEIMDYELKETGKKVEYVDYKILLEYKERKRRVQRQSWQFVEGIKELKKGYISQVVRKLVNLAIKHNAIIVFEDLNMRFKQIRGGIEKSVYQQLEKALIDKLSYLVNKGEKDSKQAGYLLKAYQLSAPFETFQKIGKQTGILFYTTASYTSRIDPVTGWRPNLYLKRGSAENNKKQILNFTKIKFVNGRFELSYDLKEFTKNKDAKFADNTKWTVCSSVERFRWDGKMNSSNGGYIHYKDVTDELEELFGRYQININGDILKQIENLDEKITENKKFFSKFIYLFSLICQIRNTDDSDSAKKEEKDDFILSPVEPFFDSRKSNEKSLPTNGDDNGAFNIARKGIITLKKIDEWVRENKFLVNKGKKEKYSPNLFISNQEWDNFIIK